MSPRVLSLPFLTALTLSSAPPPSLSLGFLKGEMGTTVPTQVAGVTVEWEQT